jgi:two-component system, sensor histidine kinase PdtaS
VSRKDAAIGLLQAENDLARRNQWLLGLGVLLLLVVSGAILGRVRSRQRHIRVLEEKNRTISGMLDEKEYLIREIHHRVKNNLQMISSLLQLQSRYMTEPGAVEALSEGESRVKSMAIIHHHLYSRDDVSSVDVQGYVESLCQQILSSFSAPDAEVELRREVEPLRLDVSVMVPLGLILNELVTNAFKYAFAGRDRGIITIRLTARGEGLELVVQDDGVGMDPGAGRSGFGTRMIGAFLKKLGAEMDTQVLEGTRVTIHIPEVRRETLVQRSA